MRADRTSSSIFAGTDGRRAARNPWPDAGPYGRPYYISEPRYGSDPVGDLPPGQRLARRFTIKSHLGRGSMGAVYLASDDLRAVEVALKVVPVVSEETASQLKHEIEHNSVVTNYEHVIHVYDVHHDKRCGLDLLLISMEYADGGSLRQWLVRNRGNVVRRRTEGVAYIVEACKGLQVLHHAGILHLDLKPENLLFVGGLLKVADLGLSRRTRVIGGGVLASGDGPDRSWLGTPAYMSREQLMPACASRVDERSDIYAVGAILFELCDERCQPPFVGSYDQVREAHLHMPIPRVGDVQAHVARAIVRCLQENPADRYACVEELIDELEGRNSAAGGSQEIRQKVPEVESLWRQACELVQVGDLNSARRVCGEILERVPEYSGARHLLQDIEGRFQEAHQYCATIQSGIGCQPLRRLLALYAAAVGIYRDHPEGHLIQTQLGSIIEEYKRALQSAIGATGRGDWQGAQACLERAGQLNPGEPAIVQGLEFIKGVRHHVEAVRTKIDAAAEQGNREKALRLARYLDRYVERATARARRSPQWESNHDTGM